MSKKVLLFSLLGVVIALFSLQNAMAFDPNWQETQKKAFEATKLKAGEVIDATNWQKIQDCAPPSVVNWVKKGEYTIKIGEFKYDYSNDQAYEKASMANEGKYVLGSRTEILDAANKKVPMYVDGRPFNKFDFQGDPMAATKFMHSSSGDRFRTGGTRTDFDIQWIGDRGMERYLYGFDMFYYYWSRPDHKELPNPQKVKRFEITTLNEPYDLFGNVMLYHYWLDGSAERFVQYIPALRRIKKMNVTDRSSPFFGTDFCNDDGGGYVGQIEAMNWKYVGEKIMLKPTSVWNLEKPDTMTKQPNGAYKCNPVGRYIFGYEKNNPEVKALKHAPVAWAPISQQWVPRTMIIFEMNSKDPYYAYGKQLLYVDKSSMSIVYKIVWNKAGQYWKTLSVECFPAQWGENRSMTMQTMYTNTDDISHHTSTCSCRGYRDKFNFTAVFNDPDNNPGIYKDEKIATMMK